jgi:nicotinate-nucleotide adenylyltransferase
MRTLCFGGSFNPVHNAHLACSNALAREAGFGRVLMIPSHQPVLKSKSYDLAAAEHRVAMLLLACESMRDSGVIYEIDALELERAGPTYTIDTVQILGGNRKSPIDWLIGADQLLNLHRWHRFDELIEITQFWIMQRPGYAIDFAKLDPRVQKLKDQVISVAVSPINATEIRQRVRDGKSIKGLVPDSVREYILRHQLFIP